MALFSDIQALVENQTNGQGLKPGDVTSSFTGRPRFFSSTDDSVNEYQEEERDRKLIGSITKAGLTIGAAYTIKTMLENQRAQRVLRQHIELSYLDDSVRRLRQGSIKTFGDRLTLTNLAMEGARRAEELSPFSILRTFQMSHFLQPFATKESELTFSSSQIRAQQTYFNDIFQKHGNRKLLATDVANGLTVKEGKLFDHAGKVVVDNVRLVAAEWEGAGTVHDETSMINRVLRRYISQGDGYSAKGLREVFNLGQSDSLNRFTVIAGKTQSEIDKQWIKSAAGSAISQGFLMVNEPAAFFQDMTETMFGKSKTIQSKPVQNFARLVTKALTINPAANTDTSVANLAKGYIREGGRKSLIAGALFYAADNAAKVVGTEDSGYGKGIIEGLATTFVNAKLSYAENVSDSFSEYKEEQEYVAPKSTSLLNLLGLPLAGMMTGGIASYAERMFQTTSSQGGYLQASNAAKKELPLISSKVSTAVTGTAFEGLLGDMSRGRRYGTRGALLGAMLTLPFLPGALIGDSSKDIREEYIEGKEVAIRSNRYWFCLHPDTQLLTNNGNKRADEVSIGDKLMDRYGSYNRVIDISIRPAAEKVYDIRTINTQCIPMKLTGEHEVLTPNGWKMAKQLSPGDKVLAPIPEFDDSNTRLHPIEYLSKDVFTVHNGFVKKNQLQKNGKKSPTATGMIPEQIDLNFNFGKLLGWFVAEGTLPSHLDNGVMEIAFHNSEVGFALEISEYIKSITGKLPRLYRNQGNGKRIRFSSYCLFNLLKSMIYRDGMKIVPDMTSFPKEVIRGFIVGMFYGDGTISKSNGVRSRWSIKSQHMQNLLELRRYLSIFHVYGSISMDSGSFKLDLGSKWSKMAHENIGIYKELYSYENGFFDRYSSNSSSVDFKDGLLEIEISSIDSFYYEGVVYDYTMENIHEYSATTFIVHNSGSNEHEGQGIKYFAKNWYQRIMNGAEDKVKYGDGETKEDMNPFYSPFEYLRNPYAFEEMHKDDMPYPVWGMDVSYGGWAGKIFEKTIGQVIKPDIINPEMYDMSEQPSALATIMSYGEQQVSAAYVTGDGSAYGKEDVTGVGIDYGSLSSIPVPTNETRNNMSLIKDGMMSRKRNLSYNPDGEAIQYTYRAATDFIGLKGWASSLVGDELGILSDDYTNELARSGEATNVARSFMSYNAGGLFGGADVLRRIIPMSSDVMYNRSNPLHNKVSPYWLPSDDSQYYVDFSKGNYYANVERGYERLPGAGYEQTNPELAGVSPDDYPDIYKYKILADVAYGSSEYYQAKDVMDNRYSLGDLTDEELNIYSTVYEQTQQRGQKKNFYEYKTDEDLEDVSAWGQVMNALWEPITHNAELPTENLTFFRPAGKLLHQRTAIEDYKKTQILGSDIAMWNRPIDHFIKPFVNESYGMFDGSFIPQDTVERRNVDSYFDALEYHKQMKIYRESMASGNTSAAEFAREQSQRTIYGALASGLDNDQEVIRAYSGLTENEKPYFSSFVNAKESDRAQISSMLDQNLSSMYNMLWERKDVAESGGDIQAYSDMEENELIARNASSYGMYQNSQDAKIGMTFREYLYDQQATKRIEDATGLPDESFVGWDPRIDLDDVKLRTLMVGKEDIRRYGYWEADEQKLQRQLAVLEETQVTQMVSSIKKSDSEKRFNYGIELKDRLSKNGIEATRIHLSNVGYGDFDMNIID